MQSHGNPWHIQYNLLPGNSQAIRGRCNATVTKPVRAVTKRATKEKVLFVSGLFMELPTSRCVNQNQYNRLKCQVGKGYFRQAKAIRHGRTGCTSRRIGLCCAEKDSLRRLMFSLLFIKVSIFIKNRRKSSKDGFLPPYRRLGERFSKPHFFLLPRPNPDLVGKGGARKRATARRTAGRSKADAATTQKWFLKNTSPKPPSGGLKNRPLQFPSGIALVKKKNWDLKKRGITPR